MPQRNGRIDRRTPPIGVMALEHTETDNHSEVRARWRVEGIMSRYWVLGLIIAVVAVIFLARRFHAVAKPLEDPVDPPLWEAGRHQHVDLKSETAYDREDTAPAVLSPPEWQPPKSTSGRSKH